MNKKLDIAIKCSIQENLHNYIQFGEFSPSLSVLESIAHKINTYSNADSVYEAIDGDSVIAMNLFAIAMEPDYFDETATRIKLRQLILVQASRVLLAYESFAWEVWEQRQPVAPDINVPMPGNL
jgi:hypothetical protein